MGEVALSARTLWPRFGENIGGDSLATPRNGVCLKDIAAIKHRCFSKFLGGKDFSPSQWRVHVVLVVVWAKGVIPGKG